MDKVMVVVFAGCALLAGCGGGNNNHGHAVQTDTTVSKVVSGLKVASALQDSTEKQVRAAPEIDEGAVQKAVVSKRDSSFQVYNNIRADYRIIGYQSPDTNSRKMVLFSVFTSDVKDNPYQCPFGSYYGSPGADELTVKYRGELGTFIKADIVSNGKQARVYLEKKWVGFED